VMQVSLRDALRSGIDNVGLQEIIGDAVLCLLPTCLHNAVSIILNICILSRECVLLFHDEGMIHEMSG